MFESSVYGLAVAMTTDRVFVAESSLHDGYRLGAFDRNLQRVGTANIGGSSFRIETQGNRIFVSERSSGLHILEVTPSGAIEYRSTYPSSRGFAVFDNYMVVAMGGRSLHVVDISNPAHPRLVADAGDVVTALGTLDFINVTMVGRQAFVENDTIATPRTVTIDLAIPETPVYVGANRWSAGRSPTLVGENLFVAGNGILAYPPEGSGFSPQSMDSITFSIIQDMQIIGTTAYLCDGPEGVRVVDISNPRDLRLITTFDTPGDALGIHVVGAKAHIADGTGGVIIADFSNLAQPREIGRFATSKPARKIRVIGDRIFLANDADVLTVWEAGEISDQTIDFPPIPDMLVTAPDFAISATASSGLPVTFTIIGPATLQNGTVHITGAGTVRIRATQAGNASFRPATVERAFTVSRLTQTIGLAPIPDMLANSPDFAVTATASSGLPVTVTAFGVATYQDGMVHVTRAGTATVRATQAGDATYDPVTFERIFQVSLVPQTINFATFSDISVIDDPFTFPAASASSGLNVTYAVAGPAILSGRTITPNGAGTVRITASQPGTAIFAPASVERSFAIRSLNDAVAADVRARNLNATADMVQPNADPDSDGIPNVVEFIMRSNPVSATSAEGRSTGSIFRDATGSYYRLHFQKPRTSRYDSGIQVGDLRQFPIVWDFYPAEFNADGTGTFLLPFAPGSAPIIRYVLQYP